MISFMLHADVNESTKNCLSLTATPTLIACTRTEAARIWAQIRVLNHHFLALPGADA